MMVLSCQKGYVISQRLVRQLDVVVGTITLIVSIQCPSILTSEVGGTTIILSVCKIKLAVLKQIITQLSLDLIYYYWIRTDNK